MKLLASSLAVPPLLVCFLLAAGCTPEQDLVIDGDVTITNAADLEQIADATRITGSLKVKRAEISSLHMPRLVEIGGRLAVQKNKALTEVLLPALATVGEKAGHEVLVEHNFALETLDLGRLKTAADGLVIRQNPKLARVELGSLSRVGRFGVELATNDGIRSLDLPELAATPRLHVESCYRLEKLGIAALAKAGSATIRANPSLVEIDDIQPAKKSTAASVVTPGKDAGIEVRDNFKLPTCEGTRLVERLTERGWSGSIAVCGNLVDSCAPKGCE